MIYGWNVIDIWLFNHCSHCLLNSTLAKFVEAVLVPDGFKVEVRAVEMLF
jgi:hypothetical protein